MAILVVSSTKTRGAAMQDYLNHLEKLRKDAAECRSISDVATDTAKRELFDRLALHLTVLADIRLSKKCLNGNR